MRATIMRLYLSMILGANFSSESGPEILLNVALLLKFGGHMTTKKGATWLFATEKGNHLWPVGTHPSSNGVAQTVPEALPHLPVQSFSPVLLPVQRLPPPATAFPTPGAGCSSKATPCQGRAGGTRVVAQKFEDMCPMRQPVQQSRGQMFLSHHGIPIAKFEIGGNDEGTAFVER